MILDVVAALLIFLAGINVVSTATLVAAALRHRWPALVERATIAVVLAVVSIGAAVIAFHRLHVFNLPSEASLSIIAAGLVLVSVPSLVWLLAFFSGKFDGDGT